MVCSGRIEQICFPFAIYPVSLQLTACKYINCDEKEVFCRCCICAVINFRSFFNLFTRLKRRFRNQFVSTIQINNICANESGITLQADIIHLKIDFDVENVDIFHNSIFQITETNSMCHHRNQLSNSK